ncbi:hypothetical protein [Castellaniella sp.]|uniref:hypothetical protein n=1 Tax=Castellaniella sp. TaxID=1955812 RepID=UPI002AFEEB38|nr:hypothetical protein [Castellaniella sp.]
MSETIYRRTQHTLNTLKKWHDMGGGGSGAEEQARQELVALCRKVDGSDELAGLARALLDSLDMESRIQANAPKFGTTASAEHRTAATLAAMNTAELRRKLAKFVSYH